MQQTGARNIPVVDFFWFSMAIAGVVVVYMLVLLARVSLRRRREGTGADSDRQMPGPRHD